jgi:hypothetical protein
MIPSLFACDDARARGSTAQEASGTPAHDRRGDHNLVTELGGLMQALKGADPADKAEIYRRIGLTLTYHPQEKRVAAEARPETIMYVGACPRGTAPKSPWLLAAEFPLVDGGAR